MCNRHSQHDSSTLVHTTKGGNLPRCTLTTYLQTPIQKSTQSQHPGKDTQEATHKPQNGCPHPRCTQHMEPAQEPKQHTEGHLSSPAPTGSISTTHTSKAPSTGWAIAGAEHGWSTQEALGSIPNTAKPKGTKHWPHLPACGRLLKDHWKLEASSVCTVSF